jgi:hypothetical protein
MRKLSERTVKSYNNNNLALFRFISTEYGIEELEEAGCYIKSLSESWIDTESPTGEFMLTVFSGLAQMERVICFIRDYNFGQ